MVYKNFTLTNYTCLMPILFLLEKYRNDIDWNSLKLIITTFTKLLLSRFCETKSLLALYLQTSERKAIRESER